MYHRHSLLYTLGQEDAVVVKMEQFASTFRKNGGTDSSINFWAKVFFISISSIQAELEKMKY